jgi:hypothetical protein
MENSVLTYLKQSLAIVVTALIGFTTLILVFTLSIVFLLMNLSKLPYIYSWRARERGNARNVLEGEYEVLDEARNALCSPGSRHGQQHEKTSR